MSSSPTETPSASALAVTVSDDRLTVELTDGRTVAVPLSWYPRLVHATAGERANVHLIGDGEGIHWPDLDEDVSVGSLLDGRRSQESEAAFERWVRGRRPGS